MTYRYVSLAFGLSTVLLGACTIVHEPSHPPPPPPPPPGHQATAQPTATATPASTAPKKMSGANLLKFMKKNQPPPPQGGGNLIVQVVDGTCVVKIDEEDYGEQSQVNAQVAAGEHLVSCAPAVGDVQSHNVTVTEGGEPTTVVFSVKTGGGGTVPKPPEGRPEIPEIPAK